MTTIYRHHNSPRREQLTWHETWRAEDNGLIHCWELGRDLATTSPELAEAAIRNELPAMDWKGGVSGTPKMKKKYGSLFYLAAYQGLRGEDLQIESDIETSLTCARTGVKVTFTPVLSKLDADKTKNTEGSASA